MENNMEVPQKVKIDLTHDQSILLLGIHPKEMKIFWRGICISVFITLATWWEELTHLKRPWCCERLKAGGEGDDRGWDGWMASQTWWTWVWVSSRSWEAPSGQGSLACCSSRGLKESDRTKQLNWTEPIYTFIFFSCWLWKKFMFYG